VSAELAPAEAVELDIAGNRLTRFARTEFELEGRLRLDCFWLQGYGGGRYLLDTAKGGDLGVEDGKLVLDFNFAYNPSCGYDACWVCPLALPGNRPPVAVEAGERAS
jgi:uncharacterized protein (DUF1684 family)